VSTATLLPEELKALRNTKSDDEWNALCDKIKKRCGGGYPGDWYAKIVLSGEASKATVRHARR